MSEASSPRGNRLMLLVLWIVFYGSFTLFTPPLLDDADSVHAEVAREMLTRHDFVTLYANGIRYLEKAPLYYWSMAGSMKVFGVTTAATRVPLALAVLALAMLLEGFARRAFGSAKAGLYAGLIALSSFGIFIFSRLNLPDILVCVLLTVSLDCFWLTEQQEEPARGLCWMFGAAIALDLLTKGLIGVVFPAGIVGLYLLLTRGWRGAVRRLLRCHPVSSTAISLAIAVPWHVLIALANPGHGHPGDLARVDGHWQVPYPTDGNVHGWAWFYFVNEQVYRYLSVRIPHDYDTSPVWIFYGLIFVWLMPWSAFLPSAVWRAWPGWGALRARGLSAEARTDLFLLVWMVVPLAFFSLSSRQEYYVLPSLPPMILLIARVLRGEGARGSVVEAADDYLREHLEEAIAEYRRLNTTGGTLGISSDAARELLPGYGTPAERTAKSNARHGGSSGEDQPWRAGARAVSWFLLGGGTLVALVCLFFILHSGRPSPHTDLASLLTQNPDDYALSFGHFLDLTGPAMALFRVPLALTAVGLFGGALSHFLLRRRGQGHAATLALAAGAFLFLLATHRGLAIFSPTLTSYQLAERIAPVLRPDDLVVIHGEYEAGSTLGFYLRRNDLHLVEGRSSNLWYGSFFPDAPRIFETRESIAAKWRGPRRIFLWQDPHDPERKVLELPGKVYVVADSGGKEILSNQPKE